MKSIPSILSMSLVVMLSVACSSHEHPGEGVGEHPGHEHGGKAVEHEHAGEPAKDKKKKKDDDHAGMPASEMHAKGMKTEFSAKEIKAAMTEHINLQTAAGDGMFIIKDPQIANNKLKLNFVKIHDPVRKIEGRGYFACTDFSVVGDTNGKLYDLDFWLTPKNGKLVITETRIHKNPKLEGEKWIKSARYTFVNDEPVVIN